LFLVVMPVVLFVQLVVLLVTRLKSIMNNSTTVNEPLQINVQVKYTPQIVNTVTDPVYVTLTMPAVPVETPSDEYFGMLLKAQDDVQTQLNTVTAPEPETDTTVNKTEKGSCTFIGSNSN